MQKIDKSKKVATAYHTWLKSLKNKKQPPNSATFRFYKDVLMNLLICQNGLCAYTEMRLLSEADLKKAQKDFKNGRYTGLLRDMPSDIEHFDSRLKENYGWKWDNLFAVFSTINQKVKRREEQKLLDNGESVHEILKPDTKNYDPLVLLKYNSKENIFYPNTEELTASEIKQVQEMIICLGLNNGYIKMKRGDYLSELATREKFGETVTPNQFITAWTMGTAV
jgi:transcriptional regulator of met regulon